MKFKFAYVCFACVCLLLGCNNLTDIEKYRKAAEQGNAEAQCKLGTCYA